MKATLKIVQLFLTSAFLLRLQRPESSSGRLRGTGTPLPPPSSMWWPAAFCPFKMNHPRGGKRKDWEYIYIWFKRIKTRKRRKKCGYKTKKCCCFLVNYNFMWETRNMFPTWRGGGGEGRRSVGENEGVYLHCLFNNIKSYVTSLTEPEVDRPVHKPLYQSSSLGRWGHLLHLQRRTKSCALHTKSAGDTRSRRWRSQSIQQRDRDLRSDGSADAVVL